VRQYLWRLLSLLPTFRYFTKAAGLVQEPANYVCLSYYPGPCHLDEFTALLHRVTRARARHPVE
jgi:hypothetical protein